MAKVRLLNGKPLMVGSKVALSDDCCCGPTPPTTCCTTATITIVFSGIVDCLGIIGDLNGSFVLTETFPGSSQWEGPGANYFNGPFEDITDIVVSCTPEELGIDYRGVGSNVLFYSFLIDPAPPSFANLPNDITDCVGSFGRDGTASITCGG